MLHRSTTIIATAGTLFFLGSLIVFLFAFHTVSEEKATFTDLRIARAETKVHQESYAMLVRKLEETSAERASLFLRILREEDVIDLLATIETLGKEQHVTLKTNSLTVEPIDTSFETLVVNITVTGRYSAVLHVLKILEYLPYQASVGRVQITHIEDETGTVWEGSFQVRVTKFTKT